VPRAAAGQHGRARLCHTALTYHHSVSEADNACHPPIVALDKLSALRIELGIATETQNGVSKTTCEIENKNQIEE
jgi:hypothetical protein